MRHDHLRSRPFAKPAVESDRRSRARGRSRDHVTGRELRAPFRERQFQHLLVAALAASSIVDERLGLRVTENRSVKFAEWPGVGPIDVALLDNNETAAAFLE